MSENESESEQEPTEMNADALQDSDPDSIQGSGTPQVGMGRLQDAEVDRFEKSAESDSETREEK